MDEKDIALIKDKLRSSSVGIAGLGGLGSNAAMALARSGIGRLVIVDFDEVEESNLNRQAYDLDQVGMRKTEALSLNIVKVNPHVNVTAFHLMLEPGNMAEPFSQVDVVIEALDEAETKARFIEEMAAAYPDKPIIAASGVAGNHGAERVRLRRSGDLHLVMDEQAPSCHDSIVLAPKVGLFASWQAALALEILLEGLNAD